jgi:hypothetical protein
MFSLTGPTLYFVAIKRGSFLDNRTREQHVPHYLQPVASISIESLPSNRSFRSILVDWKDPSWTSHCAKLKLHHGLGKDNVKSMTMLDIVKSTTVLDIGRHYIMDLSLACPMMELDIAIGIGMPYDGAPLWALALA